MYDDLIKRLRYAASYDERIVIQDCKEAADAVEELERENERLHDDLGKAIRELAKQPRWIPVTERLPEERCNYLVFAVDGAWRQISSIEIAYWDGDHFLVQSFNAVTHWMPLPEPPKEETE